MEFHSVEERVIYEALMGTSLDQPSFYEAFSAIRELASLPSPSYFPDGFVQGTFQSAVSETLLMYREGPNPVDRLEITEKTGLLGAALSFFRRAVRKVLLRWYVAPFAEQQARYNLAATKAVDDTLTIQMQTVRAIQAIEDAQKEQWETLQSTRNRLRQTERLLSDLSTQGLQLQVPFDVKASSYENKSYAQSGEDAICGYVLRGLGLSPEECTYLDIGANHAKELSNTYAFYEAGASGVLVEANPLLISELRLLRPRDTVVHACVAAQDGEPVPFYVISGDGLSTPDKEAAEAFIAQNPYLRIDETVEVETLSVPALLRDYAPEPPTLLNVDIEGGEMEVLAAMDLDTYRPKLIITEMIPYSPTMQAGQKNTEISDFMAAHNYVEYAFTGINSIFMDGALLQKEDTHADSL